MVSLTYSWVNLNFPSIPVLIALSLTIFLMVYFYFTIQHDHIQMSNQLKIHAIMWAVCAFFALNHLGSTLMINLGFTMFPLESMIYNLVSDSIYVAVTQIPAISTFFLILDRIFVILSINRRQYVQYTSVFMLIVFTLAYFILTMAFAFNSPDPEVKYCVFECSENYAAAYSFGSKIILAVANIGFGSYFAYLYFKYAKKSNVRHEKKKNYVVLLLILTELCCTVIPNTTFLYIVPHLNLTPAWQLRFRISMTVGFSMDGFISSVVFWRSLHQRKTITQMFRKNSAHVQFVKAAKPLGTLTNVTA